MKKNQIVQKLSPKQWVIKLFFVLVGSVLYAGSIGLFLDPNNLSAGGVAGVGQILSEYLPVGTGILVLLMNLPILFLGLWKFGKLYPTG